MTALLVVIGNLAPLRYYCQFITTPDLPCPWSTGVSLSPAAPNRFSLDADADALGKGKLFLDRVDFILDPRAADGRLEALEAAPAPPSLSDARYAGALELSVTQRAQEPPNLSVRLPPEVLPGATAGYLDCEVVMLVDTDVMGRSLLKLRRLALGP